MNSPLNPSPDPDQTQDSSGSLESFAPQTQEMLTQAAAVVLSMVNIAGPPVLSPLTGGANNRVYRVDVPKGSLVLKAYYQHESDTRDRLDAEFTFLKHVWAMGNRNIPQPVARLPLRQLALYGFVPGKRLQAGEVTAAHVKQAAAFACQINTARDGFAGQNNSPDLITEERPVVGIASDACFTLAHHLGSIEQRLSRLIGMQAMDTLDEQAVAFVETLLTAAWKQAVSSFRSQVEKHKLDLHQPVDEGDRVLSPSDFGFHNALALEDGSVKFIDFEYAGWDDPAKLICDFYTQIAVPVPAETLDDFTETFTACLHGKEDVKLRAQLLLPLYRIKWCAMALHDFLPASAMRRAFAGQHEDTQKRRETQLEKARALLNLATS